MKAVLPMRSVFLALALLSGFAVLPCLLRGADVDPGKLDAYIAQARKDWGVPGLAVAIVKDGKLVHAGGYGVRELGGEDAVDADTLFAIASNSKAFTSAALATLVEDGKIGWNDRGKKHLPWFQLYDRYVSEELRVFELLCHRSGLGTFSGDLLWYGTRYSSEEVVRRARFLEPKGVFRSDFGYSNLMFITAGEVLKAASGKPWAEYVEERFFVPLGMKRTRATVRGLEKIENVATPHGEVMGRLRTFPWASWDSMGPAGGVISSVRDMSLWIRMQLGQGELAGRRYFSSESSRKMWKPHMITGVSVADRKRFPSTHFKAYALGWGVQDYLGRKLVRHGGAYDGMYSGVMMVPEEGLGIVVLTNSMTGISHALILRILDAYLGGKKRDWSSELLPREKRHRRRQVEIQEGLLKKRIEGTSPALKLASYAGTYGGALYGDATVELEKGRLVLRFEPAPDFVADLEHLHYDTFLLTWRKTFPWFGRGTCRFLIDKRGKVEEMKIDVPNEDFWFTELEFKRR
ncbi:MAG: serine hydrolase [Planctomycetes bacterium]|nr:serine hydrolase [Planctomycetota bacterium]